MLDAPFLYLMFGEDGVLTLSFEHLVELRDAVAAMDTPQQEVHDDFIIFRL